MNQAQTQQDFLPPHPVDDRNRSEAMVNVPESVTQTFFVNGQTYISIPWSALKAFLSAGI